MGLVLFRFSVWLGLPSYQFLGGCLGDVAPCMESLFILVTDLTHHNSHRAGVHHDLCDIIIHKAEENRRFLIK